LGDHHGAVDMNPKDKALECLTKLRKYASTRLSVAQRDFRVAKILCDQQGMADAIADSDRAFRETGKWSNQIRRVEAAK